MNIKMLMVACALLIGGVFSIATSSIGTECYNADQNKSFKDSKITNFNFLIVNLVSAILMTLIGALSIYLALTSPI